MAVTCRPVVEDGVEIVGSCPWNTVSVGKLALEQEQE